MASNEDVERWKLSRRLGEAIYQLETAIGYDFIYYNKALPGVNELIQAAYDKAYAAQELLWKAEARPTEVGFEEEPPHLSVLDHEEFLMNPPIIESTPVGHVIMDLNGGDLVHKIVSTEMWEQLCKIALSATEDAYDRALETIGWIVTPDADWNPRLGEPPVRRGEVLEQFFTQKGAVEHLSGEHARRTLGVLFL